jgi:HK97 family phage prohead protease
MTETQAKYDTGRLAALGAKGQALRAADGEWSFPIADLDDLKSAVRCAGRDPDSAAVREHVIAGAEKVAHRDLVPDGWDADGSLKDARAWSQEQRETANDVFAALQGAVEDKLEGQFSSWSIWVQDWYGMGSDDEPYQVIYMADGDLYAASFTFEGDKVLIGDPAKVRPVTSYVERDWQPQEERKVSRLVDWRKRKAEMLGGIEHRSFSAETFEIREKDANTWSLTGYASVTETPYDVGFYQETIKRHAFKRTLGEGPDVQLLVNHEGLPLARTTSGTMRLEERERGLWVDADLDKLDPDAQRLERKMRRGDVDQMSFAFQATDQEWNEDYTQRTIRSVSIHRGDVSVVNFGANEKSLAAIRSAEAMDRLRRFGPEMFVQAWCDWRDHTLLAPEDRAGKALSASTMEVLTSVLSLVASADEAVDEAQPLLAELMGVANPDADDDESGERSEEAAAERAWTPPDRTTRARQQLHTLQREGR